MSLKRAAAVAWREEPVLVATGLSVLVTTGVITGAQAYSLSSGLQALTLAVAQIVGALVVRGKVTP